MENKEISKVTFWAMIAVALFFDGIQFGVDLLNFIPFVGFILAWIITNGISIFAWLTFFLWFRLAGSKFDSKIVTATVGTFFIELIPILNALPAWTLSIVVIFMFFQTKKILGDHFPEASRFMTEKNAENSQFNQNQN